MWYMAWYRIIKLYLKKGIKLPKLQVNQTYLEQNQNNDLKNLELQTQAKQSSWGIIYFTVLKLHCHIWTLHDSYCEVTELCIACEIQLPKNNKEAAHVLVLQGEAMQRILKCLTITFPSPK